MPPSLAGKIDVMAERLERSRGSVMKQALAAGVDQEEELEVYAASSIKGSRADCKCTS